MFYKFPRTPHLIGSKIQIGDGDLNKVSFDAIKNKHVVATEKMDGSNIGISFSDGKLMFQSRGNYLTGGDRESHFSLLKQWAYGMYNELFESLGHRYIMYGEWLYAKHTIHYTSLPHYFMEFDILDTKTSKFLSTNRRKNMVSGLGITQVEILFDDIVYRISDITSLIKPSRFTGGEDVEGIYIKTENNGYVQSRYKFVRNSFTQKINESNVHWLSKEIITNKLRKQE